MNFEDFKPAIKKKRWDSVDYIVHMGRIALYAPNHPRPNVVKMYVFRYRLVMEKKLGRFLRPGEVVHHINGDKTDDRPENLEVMTNSEHTRLHSSKNGKWAKNYDFCIRCKKSDSKFAAFGLCNRCYCNARYHQK